ncbi:MAG: hypothetical protein HY314_14025 [Acidobacteria bacterium]|nr:hypothetical protein [Acidobacteriota bacterium]
MRKSTLILTIFAVAALCLLMANFQSSVLAQRGAPPAPNDDCVNCIDIGAAPVHRSRFDTTWATTPNPGDPCISCCFFGVGQNDKSIWYCATPPAGAVVRVNTFGSDYDTVVAIWKRTGDTCPTGTFVSNPPNSTCTNDPGVTELNCNDDAANTLQSQVSAVADGSKLFIEVAECTGTAPGFGGNASVTISHSGR